MDDPYLSPKFFKAPTRQLIHLQRSGSTHYVLVLNPKSCIAPHVTDSVSTHPLHKEWELMRRILVEVGKPTIYQGEIYKDEDDESQEVSLEGIKFHYHPKLRRMPLRYLKA